MIRLFSFLQSVFRMDLCFNHLSKKGGTDLHQVLLTLCLTVSKASFSFCKCREAEKKSVQCKLALHHHVLCGCEKHQHSAQHSHE